MSAAESLAKKSSELWDGLRGADPYRLAENTRTKYISQGQEKGIFQIKVWEDNIIMSYPDYKVVDGQTLQPLDSVTEALLAYYFSISRGFPNSGRWISFNELPDGKFYSRAFQGYTGDDLAREFQNDIELFAMAAERLGGHSEPLGDRAYSFQVLPLVAILVVCWLGDEDFPTSYRILFDASSIYHLPTDALAVVGSMIKGKLIKSKNNLKR